MKQQSYPIACAIQMTSGMDLQDNLAQAQYWLENAAKAGVKLAVLPEMFPLLGQGAGFTQAKRMIQETFGDGPIQDFLAKTAKRLGIWIVGGTIPLASEDPMRSYAACLVFNEQGEVVAQYNKLHLFDAALSTCECYRESENTVPGNHIVLVETPVGKVGLAVCYDMRFPELFRELLHMGAEVFAIPVAFTRTTGLIHWEILTRAIAIHNFAYVIGAGQYGVHGMGRETFGNSVIISPCGEVMARLAEGQGLAAAAIDLTLLEQKRIQIPAIAHQRIIKENNVLNRVKV